MAPGRSKKKNTRMQAAIEAMQVYGFPENVVRKDLKELLDVYGDDNWLFIEQDSYKVLLEKILNDHEEEKDDTLAGPSTAALPPPYLDIEAINIALPFDKGLESEKQMIGATDTALVNYKSDGDDRLLLPGDVTGQKDLMLEQNFENSGEEQETNVLETNENDSGVVDPFGNSNLSPPPASHPEEPKHNVPVRKRKPCHGWISNKVINEDDLIHLEPSPIPPELAKLLFGDIRPRCKTRWNMRPQDLI